MLEILISKINTDTKAQTRAGVNLETIGEYCEAIKKGEKFPPITLFHDGKNYYIGDGWHRVLACISINKDTIIADIRDGDQRAAILFSCGANADHGLRRTNGDKRKAVLTLLNDQEWSEWSNREISRKAKVSLSLVNTLRANILSELKVQIENIPDKPRKAKRKGKEYTVKTEKIGKSKPKQPEPEIIDYDFAIPNKKQKGASLTKPITNMIGRTHYELFSEQLPWKGQATKLGREIQDIIDKIIELNNDYLLSKCQNYIKAFCEIYDDGRIKQKFNPKSLLSQLRNIHNHIKDQEKKELSDNVEKEMKENKIQQDMF